MWVLLAALFLWIGLLRYLGVDSHDTECPGFDQVPIDSFVNISVPRWADLGAGSVSINHLKTVFSPNRVSAVSYRDWTGLGDASRWRKLQLVFNRAFEPLRTNDADTNDAIKITAQRLDNIGMSLDEQDTLILGLAMVTTEWYNRTDPSRPGVLFSDNLTAYMMMLDMPSVRASMARAVARGKTMTPAIALRAAHARIRSEYELEF